MSRGRAVALAAGAALIGVVAALRPVAGLDIWWHLRVGERLRHGAGWLPVDTLSDGAAGRPWPYKDVLADVALSLLHDAFGDAALSALPAAVAAALVLALGVGGRAGRAPADRKSVV